MAESNQKHMKPSWATGQTVSIREEFIIYNGSFLGGQFSCALVPFPLSLSLVLSFFLSFLCSLSLGSLLQLVKAAIIITVDAAAGKISTWAPVLLD